jgi:hypothetical protein
MSTTEQDERYQYPEGSTTTCLYCGLPILLDRREGGGSGKDWGCDVDQWQGYGGIGMDYGCEGSPGNDDEGTGGHEPDRRTIVAPDSARMDAAISTEADARDAAISWSQEMTAGDDLSYGELAWWGARLEALAERFPGLADELRENGLL